MRDYVIGIDIGTGSTKALAIDFRGKIIGSEQVYYPTIHPQPGYCEQSPDLIWDAFMKCIGRLTLQHPQPHAIVLSAAMHSVIPLDGHGNPLMNMITWADNRSGEIARRVRTSSVAEMLYEQTGTPIHSMTPLCKLVWLRENAPEIFRAAAKFVSIKEFIWQKLFGEVEADHSIASASGLMDVERIGWNQNAMELAGIDESRLARLVSTDHTRADCKRDVAMAIGIPASVKFIIGGSDGCLANVGTFAIRPGIAALTIGTSGAVRIASNKPVLDFSSMIFSYRLDKDTFICGGPTNNGGSALKWFAENVLERPLATVNDYKALLKDLNTTSPTEDDVIFLPYLLGERAPLWNSDATGGFFNVRSTHRQRDFVQAVIEGISFALYDIASRMMESGIAIDQVNVSGGFVHTNAWLQILADTFNKRICLTQTDDASATGAAFLGLKTLGATSSYDALHRPPVKEFIPNAAHAAVYARKFKRFHQLSRTLQSYPDHK